MAQPEIDYSRHPFTIHARDIAEAITSSEAALREEIKALEEEMLGYRKGLEVANSWLPGVAVTSVRPPIFEGVPQASYDQGAQSFLREEEVSIITEPIRRDGMVVYVAITSIGIRGLAFEGGDDQLAMFQQELVRQRENPSVFMGGYRVDHRCHRASWIDQCGEAFGQVRLMTNPNPQDSIFFKFDEGQSLVEVLAEEVGDAWTKATTLAAGRLRKIEKVDEKMSTAIKDRALGEALNVMVRSTAFSHR